MPFHKICAFDDKNMMGPWVTNMIVKKSVVCVAEVVWKINNTNGSREKMRRTLRHIILKGEILFKGIAPKIPLSSHSEVEKRLFLQ